MRGQTQSRLTQGVKFRVCSLLLAVVLITATGGASVPARVDGKTNEIGLVNCRLTVHFLKESDGERMHREGWLPKEQKLATFPPYGPGSASLLIWVFACEHVEIDRTPIGPAMLSLTGIQIEDRLAHSLSPTHWDNYLVWAHTDNGALKRVMQAAKLPTFSVPDMRLSWRAPGGFTTVAVPWRESPFELSVRGRVNDEPHLHDNTFQHGDRPGIGPRLELVIDPLVPRDKFCIPQIQPDCMSVSTKPDSLMDRFLGTATYFLGADHQPISKARVKVVTY